VLGLQIVEDGATCFCDDGGIGSLGLADLAISTDERTWRPLLADGTYGKVVGLGIDSTEHEMGVFETRIIELAEQGAKVSHHFDQAELAGQKVARSSDRALSNCLKVLLA
jgi:hypothetical protein